MSFRSSLSDVVLCNRALDMLPAANISSLDDPGAPARACRLHYKYTVAALLDKHSWNMATVRQNLAEKENDRPNEWVYAYQRPNEMAFPIKVVADGSSHTLGYYQGLRRAQQANMMEIVGDTIYSSTEVAQLDFTSFDITESDFTEEFAHIVVLHLAAKLVMPITKQFRREQALMDMAANALNAALARNLNENQPTYADTPTESELVRFVGGAHRLDRYSDRYSDRVFYW